MSYNLKNMQNYVFGNKVKMIQLLSIKNTNLHQILYLCESNKVLLLQDIASMKHL